MGVVVSILLVTLTISFWNPLSQFLYTVYSFLRNLPYLLLTLSQMEATQQELMDRISESPGFPVSNPTVSPWQAPPHHLSNVGTTGGHIPLEADVVVIGSGITAAAVVRTLLRAPYTNIQALRVVVLEARELCSGATGRNAGHVKTSQHIDFHNLKERFSPERARAIIDFKRRHYYDLKRAVDRERCRQVAEFTNVETVDVYMNEDRYNRHRAYLSEYFRDCIENRINDYTYGTCTVAGGSEAKQVFIK